MKAFIVTLLLIATCTVQAQLTITSNYRQDGAWNTTLEKWDITAVDETLSVFNFDKELYSFRHIANTITSDYDIIDFDYNEEKILYTMDIISDAGNDYEMMIDGVNNCVAFFYYDAEDNYKMVRYTIKESHFDE